MRFLGVCLRSRAYLTSIHEARGARADAARRDNPVPVRRGLDSLALRPVGLGDAAAGYAKGARKLVDEVGAKVGSVAGKVSDAWRNERDADAG